MLLIAAIEFQKAVSNVMKSGFGMLPAWGPDFERPPLILAEADYIRVGAVAPVAVLLALQVFVDRDRGEVKGRIVRLHEATQGLLELPQHRSRLIAVVWTMARFRVHSKDQRHHFRHALSHHVLPCAVLHVLERYAREYLCDAPALLLSHHGDLINLCLGFRK